MTVLRVDDLLADAEALAATIAERARESDDGQFVMGARSLYDPPEARGLLNAVQPRLEEVVGEELQPVRTFARVYAPGATLREHTDREPLDWTVSVDLTGPGLWPLEIRGKAGWRSLFGRAVAVAGGSVPHRRSTPYGGNAPAVILLLHYRRTERSPTSVPVDGPCYHLVTQMLKREDLQRLYTQLDDAMLQPGMISFRGIPSENRANRIMWLKGDAWQWLDDIVRQTAAYVNDRAWRRPLAGSTIDALQFTRYEEGEHYGWHRDRDETAEGATAKRTLSVVVLLQDPVAGGGLEIRNVGVVPLAPGDAAVFPSEVEHRALPVDAGVRDSLILWLGEP